VALWNRLRALLEHSAKYLVVDPAPGVAPIRTAVSERRGDS
jgi:hypothetical protein